MASMAPYLGATSWGSRRKRCSRTPAGGRWQRSDRLLCLRHHHDHLHHHHHHHHHHHQHHHHHHHRHHHHHHHHHHQHHHHQHYHHHHHHHRRRPCTRARTVYEVSYSVRY